MGFSNGAAPGTPKGSRKDCSDAADAAVLPTGYAQNARLIADRMMILSGYRLADLLQRATAN